MGGDPIPIYPVQSMSNMTQLSDDMVLEILIRLPCCKIAMMCRSVCKRWFTIISHHSFGMRFLHHHGKRSKESILPICKRKRVELDGDETESQVGGGLKKWKMSSPLNHNKHHHHVFLLADEEFKEVFWYMAGPCCKGPEFSMTPLPLYEGANLCVVAAWNDLILCMSRGSGINKHKVCPTEPYFLYNPLTKQGSWLPSSPSDIEHGSTIGLICEPYLNAVDLVTNYSYRYWVVFFDGKDATTKELGVRMFSSCTGKWSRFFVSSPDPMRLRRYNSTFVVGRKIYTYSSTTGILGFDPCIIDDITDDKYEKEKHVIEGHFIDWPRGSFNRKHLAAEMVLKSCSDNKVWLLLQLDFSFTKPCLRVWSREDYNNGDWWLKHSRCFQLLENYDSCFSSRLVLSCSRFTHMNLIGFHQTEGDDDDGDVVYLMAEQQIVMCNLREGKMQLVGRIPDSVVTLKWFWTTLSHWPTPLLEPTKLA